MKVNYIEEKAVTIGSMTPESEDKTSVTLVKPNDQNFATRYGNRGLVTSIDNVNIEKQGLHVGCVVDYKEELYYELCASRYEEVRDASMPKNVKAYILTEMANMLEACDQGMISERERDQYFSVMSAHIRKSQVQTKVEDSEQKR